MLTQLSVSTRRFFVQLFSKPIVVATIALAAAGEANAIDVAVGPREVIYTKSQRSSRGGANWPDGNLGVISNGDGTYDFYGANARKKVKTTGTLTDPGITKKSVKIEDVIGNFDYVSGGPVYEDPTTSTRLMIYHAEEHTSKRSIFRASLGLAVSTDPDGLVFRDLGTIIEPNVQDGLAEVGGGSFAIFNNYLNVYYKDWLADGSTAEVAVARAPLNEVINNALNGQVTAFTKYHNGSFSQPGRGGISSHLEVSNAANSWLSVSYNDYINQVVMVSSQWSGDGGDLYMATSSDGVNFSPRQPIAVNPGEQFYPTIIGSGPDPTHSGQSFFVYYTDSKKGIWSRWKDAQLVRREISINPGDPTQPRLDWVQIGDYQDDFQGGTPAEGWTYAWNPKGKVGKSSGNVSLQWSQTEQAYNTTGGITPSPNPKSHNDDYLELSFDSGHPGNKNYLPMIGYTIQQDDGAGFYRIADSTIHMADSAVLPKEDGVEVLVYINDKALDSATSVFTNGSWSSFDQDLGRLNIGDTIWVMIDPLKNQFDDSFLGFDFSIQKWDYLIPPLMMTSQSMMSQAQVAPVVPEPSSAALCIAAICGLLCGRRCRRKLSVA